MKVKEWATPNRMLFESEHKTFNKQTQLISTGNVCATTQYSGYIRSFYTTDCNGHTSDLGHLQDYDMKQFIRFLPYHVLQQVKELTRDNGGILYVFKHYSNGRLIVDGAILTDRQYKHIKSYYIGNSYKQWSIVDTAKEYITE